MVKFFRHLRFTSIADDKMKNYFKYAFGEILLIVIGILIALQINNWNENRKNTLSNLQMLKQIKEENLLNNFVLQRDKEYRDTIARVYTQFAQELAKKDIESNQSLIQEYITKLFRSTAYTFAQNSLMSFINNNKNSNSQLTQELITLSANMSDLELISKRGFDLKFENFYNGLGNDVDLSDLKVKSFKTLSSLEFRNKMIMNSYVEEEISTKFDQTRKQQLKVDSLLTSYLIH